MDYLPRIVDAELNALLTASGAVLVEGSKASGKTFTASQGAKSQVMLDIDENAQWLASTNPLGLLDGPVPRLIDEWQLAPSIWNHVRRAVDQRAESGQFILTGSAVPADDLTRHTGAGRIARLKMRPMSLFELGHSTGAISLGALLEKEDQVSSQCELSIDRLAELICTGGWPGNMQRNLQQAMTFNRAYIEEIRRTDVAIVSGQSRDPVRVGRLLRSLARNISTPVALSRLAAEVGDNGAPAKTDTVSAYIDALERLMVVEHQPAWSPSLRSRTVLRQKPIRHFVDPSLATAALRATPARLTADLRFLGFLFESMVIRDLRIYAQANDAEVFHYREKDDLEVDAVIETADGRWAAFEVKLGARWIEEGAKNLRVLAKRMEHSDLGKPAALAVVVPHGYGAVKYGEVGIVPIGALGP